MAYAHLMQVIRDDLSRSDGKQRNLRDLDMFVLDNSLRETTVAQLLGHTPENKWSILEEVKKCGFENIIVAGFSHLPRVDDTFAKMLCEKETDMSNYFAFTEIGEGHLKEEFPAGLKKMQKYNIQNPIIELNLSNFQPQTLYDLLQNRIDFAYKNLSTDAKIFVNIRDLTHRMITSPDRVFDTVKFLGTMPVGKRPFGIMFEEPTGEYLPEQLGAWAKGVRQLMNECNWDSAHMLVHVHKKWELAEAVQLECLANGVDGVWASISEEGGALGHACSTNSIMNLVRMGNTKVLKKYNCSYLRQAAINITKITTGQPPQPKQTIYGERALDIVFDLEIDEQAEASKFDLSEFFGVHAPNRVHTLSSPRIIKDRLVEVFGMNDRFTEERAAKMKAVMIDELSNGCKEEYMSPFGLSILFHGAGGKLTPEMSAAIKHMRPNFNA